MDKSLDKYAVQIWTKRESEAFEKEWQMHLDAVVSILHRYGRPYAFSDHKDDDFLVVEDILYCRLIKVCILRMAFVTRDLAAALQRCLYALESNWGVMLNLELDDPRYTGDGRGIIVLQNQIEEYWDVDRLRRELGEDFKW